MKANRFIYIIILALGIFGCTKNPEFSDIPEISFIGFSKTEMIQNSLNTDSLFLSISFKDGDGDFGQNNQITEHIVIIDNRTGEIFDRFKLPEIPSIGAQNGIEGEIQVKLFTTCCIFPGLIPPCVNPPEYPTNEITFDIYMFDDAGNKSNTITTQSVTLICD